MPELFAGIDVQLSRPCAIALIDAAGRSVATHWLPAESESVVARAAVDFVKRFPPMAVGIDAPRGPLPTERMHYWETGPKRWRYARTTDLGRGRHCEVVVAAHRLASPQWTPLRVDAPPWMLLGFALFAALGSVVDTYEVFPAASYRLLRGSEARVEVDLAAFLPGPKDLLDAYVGAITVREYVQGRGIAVGGKDGLGEIILPRPIPQPIPAVLDWPAA